MAAPGTTKAAKVTKGTQAAASTKRVTPAKGAKPLTTAPAKPLAGAGGRTAGSRRQSASEQIDLELSDEMLEAEDVPIPSPDEPLVAVCRRYLTVGMSVDTVLKTLLEDRTIVGMCNKQVYRYHLPSAESADLLQELGVLFYRRLLPRLRDPEKVWHVCAVTVRRLAAARKAKRSEYSLEDMAEKAGAARRGAFDADNAAAFIAGTLLLKDSQDGQHRGLEDDVARRMDRDAAIAKLTAFIKKEADRAVSASTLHRGRDPRLGPPAQFDPASGDPSRESPLVQILFDRTETLPKLPRSMLLPVRPPAPPVQRMPPSYGKALVRLMEQLGFTQKTLAEALGISESSCAQYMSGQHGMPMHTWEEVLELQKQGAPRRQRLQSMFDNRSIQEILAAWMRRVETITGTAPNLAEISRIMEVNKSTVTRWARDEQRPTLERLGELEEALQGWLTRNTKSARAMARRAAHEAAQV